MQIQTRSMYDYNHSQMMMSSSASSPPTLGYIQHPISKLDTLAGIAIKYGVEVLFFSLSFHFVTYEQILHAIILPLGIFLSLSKIVGCGHKKDEWTSY